MKWINGKRHMAGISLIDALIAIVVLAVGLVALSKFHGEMIAAGGLAKTRSQAVTLAQEKMELLRINLQEDDDYEARVSGSDTPASGFTRTWTVTDGTSPNRKTIDVAVAWIDPREGDQTTTLSSVVIWDNPAASALAEDLDTFEGTGELDSPTGGGQMGDESIYTPEEGDLVSSDNGDGTKFVKSGTDVLLLSTADNLLLTVSPTIIKITGTVTLDSTYAPSGFDSTNMVDLEPVAADAGVCTEAISGSTLTYNCYVGSLWYGRIALMARENSALVHVSDYANSDDQVCPLTYRYGSTAELESNANYVQTIEGDAIEPFLAGVLTNQNFVVMNRQGTCSNVHTISGELEVDFGSISGNNINVTASGASQGCVVAASDTATSHYSCSVSEGWTGTIAYTSGSCDAVEETTYSVGIAADVSAQKVDFTNCTGGDAYTPTVTLSGYVEATSGAFDVTVSGSGTYSSGAARDLTCITGSPSVSDAGYTYPYSCTSVPQGWSGILAANASNCTAGTAASTVPTDASDPYSGPAIQLDPCGTESYTVSGTLTDYSGNVSWNKVTLDIIQVADESCDVTASREIANTATYTCTFDVNPGTYLTLQPGDTDRTTYEYSPSSESGTVGYRSATITGVDFSVYVYAP